MMQFSLTLLPVLAAVSEEAYIMHSSCLSWLELSYIVLASSPLFGCLCFPCLFSRSILLLGRFVPAVIRGVFVKSLVVDRHPSVLDVGLVVVLYVCFIFFLPWCACLRSVSW